MTPRVLIKGLGLILSLALFGYFFNASDLGNSINEAWIDKYIRDRGIEGGLLFLGMGALFTAIGLPRQIIAFLAGYAFSLVIGTLLGAVAALLGCAITFMYARLFGKGLLRMHLGDRARRFDNFIRDHPFSMTLLIRLLPVGSNVLTNLAAGISSIRPASFLSASFIGVPSADPGFCADWQRHRPRIIVQAGYRRCALPQFRDTWRLSVPSTSSRP